MPAEVAVRRDVKLDPASMTLGDWELLCDYLAKSDIVPDSLSGKPANIFLVIQMGMELGVSWARALQLIYSPGRGQTGIRGTLLVNNIRKAGHKIRWEEFEDGCTCRIWRADEPDEPYEATFTKADAEAAKLTGKENYIRYRKRMYRWRSTSDCAGFACPEVMLGFAVIEAMDEASEPVQLRPETPAAGPGLAATGDPSQALADLEAKFLAESADGGVSEDGGESAEPVQVEASFDNGERRDGPADRPTQKRLSDVLTAMGWTKRYMPDILRMFSAYCGRPVAGIGDMRAGEVINLTGELTGLQEKGPQENWPVLLADKAGQWMEKWAETDPNGYRAYTGEG